jgi:hypothetical protein
MTHFNIAAESVLVSQVVSILDIFELKLCVHLPFPHYVMQVPQFYHLQ